MCNMMSLWLSMWAGYKIKGNYQNVYTLQYVSQNDKIFYVHKLGTYVYISMHVQPCGQEGCRPQRQRKR